MYSPFSINSPYKCFLRETYEKWAIHALPALFWFNEVCQFRLATHCSLAFLVVLFGSMNLINPRIIGMNRKGEFIAPPIKTPRKPMVIATGNAALKALRTSTRGGGAVNGAP